MPGLVCVEAYLHILGALTSWGKGTPAISTRLKTGDSLSLGMQLVSVSMLLTAALVSAPAIHLLADRTQSLHSNMELTGKASTYQ